MADNTCFLKKEIQLFGSSRNKNLVPTLHDKITVRYDHLAIALNRTDQNICFKKALKPGNGLPVQL